MNDPTVTGTAVAGLQNHYERPDTGKLRRALLSFPRPYLANVEGVKSPAMNNRKWWKRFYRDHRSNIHFWVINLVLFQPAWSPWIVNLFTESKDRLVHALGLAVATSLPILAVIRGHKLLPMVRSQFARRARRPQAPKNTIITPPIGHIGLDGQAPEVASTEPLPAGTASAVAMAAMPAPTRQESIRAQWDAVLRREHALATSFMMGSRVRGFNAATMIDYPTGAE